jgi:hypothetical protein
MEIQCSIVNFEQSRQIEAQKDSSGTVVNLIPGETKS